MLVEWYFFIIKTKNNKLKNKSTQVEWYFFLIKQFNDMQNAYAYAICKVRKFSKIFGWICFF